MGVMKRFYGKSSTFKKEIKMNKNEFLSKLKKAQKFVASAKEKANEQSYGASEVEDGRYLARLTRAELCNSKSSGRLQVAWSYEIEEGEFKGEKVSNYDGCETEENLKYLFLTLSRFGIEAPDDLSEELEEILKNIEKSKPICKIQIKTKGEYQNVYLQKVLNHSETKKLSTEDSEYQEDENSESEESEESVEIEVGSRVSATLKKGEVNGEVVEILEEENLVKVKGDDGKVYKVDPSKLSLLASEPPSEPEDDGESEDEEDSEEDNEEEENEDEENEEDEEENDDEEEEEEDDSDDDDDSDDESDKSVKRELLKKASSKVSKKVSKLSKKKSKK